VNFKNTIIIMTSNIGARFIQKKSSMGFQSSDTGEIAKSVTDMVLGEVKRTFNPEFINRIDEIIVFEALGDEICGGSWPAGRAVERQPDRSEAQDRADTGRHRLDHRDHLQGPSYGARRCAGRSSATSRIRCRKSSSEGTCGGEIEVYLEAGSSHIVLPGAGSRAEAGLTALRASGPSRAASTDGQITARSV
jgi:hypothetical protein